MPSLHPRLAALLLGGFLAGGPAVAQAPEVPRPDRIAQVVPAGEFVLASGLRVRLADVRIPDEGAAVATARSWLASLAGEAVLLAPVGESDRWGRQAAGLSLAGSGAPLDIGELLVAEGLAVMDVGERSGLTRTGLPAAEAGARAARRGIWAEAGWPLAADAPEELARRAGGFAVVEGRVVSVGERRDRTYLNFGRDWSRDFAVTIPRRTWTSLVARGVTATSLTGARVRVRGVLEMRRAPALDIVAPEMLEVVAAGPGRSDDRPRRR